MHNPLLNVPLNTKQIYVRAKTPSGCEIFMPVNHEDAKVVESMKTSLQNYLNHTYPLPEPEEPQVA